MPLSLSFLVLFVKGERAMKKGLAVTCLMALFLLFGAGSITADEKADDHAWLTKHPTILRMQELQNQERARNGLPPLKMNVELCLLAQKHARWMADTGWYMHSSYGIPEIIHSGPMAPEDAVNGWIWSPAHHWIMLSGSEAGFGYMVRNGATYWVTLVR